jgi:hypothetical protein
MRTMNRASRFLLTVVAVAAVSGCATITYEASAAAAAVTMNRPAGTYERVASFETDRRAVFVIASLITVVDADLEEALRREMARAGGDAVINLRIMEQYDIIDFAIGAVQSILLFGAQVVNTRSITIRGDVVRWTGAGGAALDRDPPDHCRAVELEAADGARTGHICVQPGGGLALTAP